MTDFSKVLNPGPQEVEQELVCTQFAVSTQSTGQIAVMQAWVSSVAPHSWPPWSAARLMERVLERVPPSHVTEHSDHLVQVLGMQSTGQGLGLQVRTSSFWPHLVPAAPGWVMIWRWRCS